MGKFFILVKEETLSKRIIFGIVSALLLIGVFSLSFNIQPAHSEAHTIIVPDDYPSIQGAIDAANAGDTIFVRNGSYGPVVVNKGVKLVGENRESTVITGSSGHAVEVIADNVTVTGFTVVAGESIWSGTKTGISANSVKGINVSQNFMTEEAHQSI